MQSLVVVTVPAASIDLITVDDLAAELSQQVDSARMALSVTAASNSICRYLRRPLAQETVSETFRRTRYQARDLMLAEYRQADCNLILSRYPVGSITSVVEDGTTLDPTNYELDPASGRLARLASDHFIAWMAAKTVITYVAGYILPPDPTATLPAPIQLACRRLAALFFRTSEREPGLRSEIIPGVIEKQYWDQTRSGQADDDLPADIRAILEPYRMPL
jgi:hypothetical protein